MNLIVDVGNTSIKVALFKEGALLEHHIVDQNSFLELINKISEDFEISHGIISSVAKFPKEFVFNLEARVQLIQLNASTKVPFINTYKTPNTLGVDRLALVSAAAVQFPQKNVLVIDAGSCITYDFLSHENEYLGGAISPGLNMRFKALNTFTANLPLLMANPLNEYVGKTTKECIQSGVVNGLVAEIDGIIETYKKDFSPLKVILTGGDTLFLRDRLKSDIFANSNFLLEGLHHILEHNKD